MRCVLLGLLLLSPVAFGSTPPIDEIRSVLARELVEAPKQAQLSEITSENVTTQLKTIDASTRWFTPQEYGRARNPGSQSGIGAALADWNGRPVIIPYEHGPLARMGIQGPVYLRAIDGRPIERFDKERLAKVLKDESRASIRIGVSANYNQEVEEFTVARGAYRTKSVERLNYNGFPVIRIRTFSPRETCTLLFLAFTEEVDSNHLAIIDLRDNPGGDLYEALDCAALFVPSGEILARTRDREHGLQDYVSPPGTKLRSAALVIWVGPGTASAAEIFAGILQQRRLARLVGAPTYGKCSSQTDVRLTDGSVLRLTNRYVLFPDGTSCNGVGLRPDASVSGAALLDGHAMLKASRN